jgi:hypothetical protein
MKFVGSNGVNAIAERLEGRERGRQGGVVLRVGASDFTGQSRC